MKRFLAPIVLALFSASSTFANPAPEFVRGDLLLRAKSGYSTDLLAASVGGRIVGGVPRLGIARIRLDNPGATEFTISSLRRHPGVDLAEPNFIRRKFRVPNDPRFGEQYGIQRMSVPLAWDLTIGHSDVVIAVLDTGVDYTHQDLTGKVILGIDTIDNDLDPMDSEFHGTHVAGIAAANTNNGIGIAGVGWNSRILAVRVLGNQGGTDESVANGIIYAADQRADVINMSLGGYGVSATLEQAVNYAHARGSVQIASAGNDNISRRAYPAAFINVIAVGSTDRNDQKSDFSNFGPDWVDVAAPGSAILSTIPGNQYASFDGTSMSAPNAAGVAALVIARAGRGNLTNVEVRSIIENNCDPTTPNFVRFGRVNANRAVNAATPPIIGTFAPREFRAATGFSFAGGLSDVIHADGNLFSITSRSLRAGNITESEGLFRANVDRPTLQSIRLAIRSQGPSGSSGLVWMFNNRTGVFTQVGTFAVSTTMRTTSLRITARPADFLDASGNVRFRMRSLVPTRISQRAYEFRIDQVSFETTNRTGVRP